MMKCNQNSGPLTGKHVITHWNLVNRQTRVWYQLQWGDNWHLIGCNGWEPRGYHGWSNRFGGFNPSEKKIKKIVNRKDYPIYFGKLNMF